MYRAVELKATVKKKARDAQFGGLAKKMMTGDASDTQEVGKDEEKTKHPVTLDKFEGCFDSLVTAAMTGKDQIEVLVKSNATLTKNNTDLPDGQVTTTTTQAVHVLQ